MFERFTDQARHAVALASEAARAHNHEYLGTEHLLLGILRESDSDAATALESWGISADAIDSRLIGIGTGQPETARRVIPFTPQAKKVLEQSMREISLLGHDRIGTEHLLLALIDNRQSAGARLLREAAHGDIAQLRPHILRQVAEQHRTPGSIGPTHMTVITLTAPEHALCAVAAAKAGQHLDAWMRERILDAARAHGTAAE